MTVYPAIIVLRDSLGLLRIKAGPARGQIPRLRCALLPRVRLSVVETVDASQGDLRGFEAVMPCRYLLSYSCPTQSCPKDDFALHNLLES
jgi:hypothetical protein